MPSGNTTLHTRALRRAQAHESLELTWGEVVFSAVKNPLPPAESPEDRNDGDNTGCILTAVVSAESGDLAPDELPQQGEIFTDADGRSYRVARVDYTSGLPAISFHIANVVTPA